MHSKGLARGLFCAMRAAGGPKPVRPAPMSTNCIHRVKSPRGHARGGLLPAARLVQRAWFSELPHGQAEPSAPRALVMVVVASAVLSVDAFCKAAM